MIDETERSDVIAHVIRTLHRDENAPASLLLAKLLEEGGELAEAALIEEGLKPHKAAEDGVLSEAADVILTVLAVVSRTRRSMPPDVLANELHAHLHAKFARYAQRIREHPWKG